ncbi:MAG: hypothetical protein CVV22_06540 [Ignavibacteriae bacterium HGW-Ignavibacteriae-1]|jgi:hypothetical protein|nr:MAG: hypothetical protein CVV22_06540 [Ignavibacteriae bacterium HGW-Ignavibacteriae-1]
MKKIFTRFLIFLFAFTIYVQQAEAKVEIGTAEYTTLSAAFTAINNGTHTGNIVAKITGDISESARAILNASGQGSADYNSVVIYPTGNYKISGNQATALIELRGADDVTFDGRQNQSGTTNSLTIENISTSSSTTVIWLDSNTAGGGGASNNTIRNINIVGGSLTTSYGIVTGSSSSLTTAGAGNDNNTIAYCTFKKLYYGIRSYGLSTGRSKNLKIYGNQMGSSDPSETVATYGMYIYYTDGAEIYDNTLDKLTSTSTVYGLYFYYGNESKIYNNTFSNFKSGSSMYVFYMLQSPYTEFYGNKVENMNSGGLIYNCYLSTGNYSKFYDNSIKNIVANGSMYGYYCSSNQYGEVYNNQIDNITTTGLAYLYYNTSCPYMIIEDNRATNVYNASTMYGVYLSSGTEGVVQRNYFDNLMNSSGTSYGLYLSSCSKAKVLNNRIGNQTATTYSYGIYFTTVADAEVFNNEIFGLTANGSSTTGAWGIFIAGTSSNTKIINNTIANIRTTQWSTTGTTTNPFGIAISGGTGYKIWHNSVQLTGKQVEIGTTGTLSACLMLSSTSVNTIDLRNNLFSNTLEGLSGSRSFCVYLSSSSNLSNSTLDYNNYYAGGTYGMIGYLNSDISNLSGWQSATSRESNSSNYFTEFNSINNNSPVPGSEVIGQGTGISEVVYDITGVQRSATNPTPGAYEKAADLLGPEIVFEKLAPTTSTDNRVLVATITDYTAVNKTSSAPRLYYRAIKNTNAWVGNSSSQDGWKYATATINGDEYSFTLDYNKIYDGIEIGDVYEYFIVAQDIAPTGNIGVSKGFFSVNPTSTSLTAENFPFYDPDNFKVAEAIEGEITVGSGSGKDYATLTDAGGVFEYLNSGILTGDVEVIISTDIPESGTIALGKLLYEGAEYYNVTFKPSEAKVKRLSGALASGSIISLVGASYVTFDGSYDGEGRYLEITNQQTSGYNAAIAIGSGGAMLDGGKFVTIQNCVIFNNYILSTSGSFGIIVTDGAITTSASSPGVNNLTIRNNEIYKSSYGIVAAGSSSSSLQNLLIENNEIGSTTTGSEISVKGLDITYTDNVVIRGNKIFNFTTAYSTTRTGIEITGSTSTNALIENNIIYGMKQTASSTVGCYGINILGGTGHSIVNNYISDITTSRMSSTSTTGNPFGIRVGSGSGHKIWHNTIIMKGSQAAAGTTPSLTANIIFSSSYLNNDVRGNILHNSISGVNGTSSFNIFLYSTSNLTNVLSILDHNNYTIGGDHGKYGGYGTSYPFSNVATTLTAWKNMTGKDVNSFSVTTYHIGDTDMHLNSSSVGNTNLMIPRMDDVLYDSDGELRKGSTYVGADEVIAYLNMTEDNTLTPEYNVYCVNDPLTMTFDFDLEFGDKITRDGLSSVDIVWFKNNYGITDAKSKKLEFESLEMSDSATYYARAKFMDVELITKSHHVIVETPIAFDLQPKDEDVCSTDPQLLIQTLPTGNIYGYQWEFRKLGTSTYIPMPGETSPEVQLDLNDPESAIGHYRLEVTGPGNCGPEIVYSDVSFVNISDPLENAQLEYEGDLTYICKDESIAIHATGDGTIFGYQWQKSTGTGFIDLSLSEYPTANTHTLVMTNMKPDESADYRCMILGSTTCGTPLVPTPSTAVKVWDFFAIEEHPESQVVCAGEEVTLKVFAEGTIYGFQWLRNGVEISTEENFYADKRVLILPNVEYDNSGIYQCLLTVEDCAGKKTVISNPAAVYVATPTEFTRKPTTQSVMLGNSINWVVRSHLNGAPPEFEPKVQWFRGSQQLLESPRFIGTKSNSLIIDNIQDSDYGDDYWVVVYGLCGNDTVRNFGLLKSEFSITAQPTGASVCQGEFVSFSVSASSSTGEPISYRWYKDGVALLDNADYVGSHTNTLTINNSRAELNGDYYCEVKVPSSQFGLYSYTAILEVTDLPAITKDLELIVNLEVGDNLILEVETTGTDLIYQWYFDTEAIPSANEASYSIESVDESNSGNYYVVILNACGEVTSEISVVNVTTSTSDVTNQMKDGYSLGAAVPNPVNASSVISYEVATDGFVEIVLIDQLGVEVAKLVNTRLAGGEYQLNIDANALRLTSGVYSVVMRANGVQLIQRIAVVK